jgi:hypothetical protein
MQTAEAATPKLVAGGEGADRCGGHGARRGRCTRPWLAHATAAQVGEDRLLDGAHRRASANLTAAVTASDVTASLRVTVSCDDVTLETGLSAAQPLRRHRGVTASLFGA